ncbi:unnamed protein product [Closterium sp. NIES-64]|nr:unnamed protein product [Closterium sp. NIES-64]
MADSSVHSRPMAAQGAEDGEEDLEDDENTDQDYAQDCENDSEFEATEEDLFQGGLYEPSVRIQVQGSVEGSEGPGGDGVRPRPGAPEERYEEDGDHSDAEEEGESSPGRRRPPDFASHVEQAAAPGNAGWSCSCDEWQIHLHGPRVTEWRLGRYIEKSKTNPNNKLSHQFLARHRDWRLCGMGHVFLWLHFIYDLVPLRYGPGIVEPLDFSEPILWTKAHLFFSLKKGDQGKQKQDVMHYKMHNTWIKWAMTKARWILSKVTHAFHRSGAQQLHDDGCSDNDIGTLGGWAQGELRRCYVFGIPFKPDLAMMWAFCHQHGVRNPRCNCERHPYVQMSPLCNHPLFQKWAYLVAISHFQGEKLRATGQTTAKADAIFRTTAEEKMQKMHLTANMLREELGILRGREMQLAMENAELREKLAAEREDKARVIAEFEAYKRSLREVFAEFDRYKKKDKNSSFITAYSRFAYKGTPGMAVGACERKMRRVHRVMVSVETLRKDSSERATATTIKLLDEVLLVCNFTEFTNGLAVLHETPPIKKQKTSSSTEKRTVNDLAQRRVGWLLVKKGLRDQEWATSLFGDDEWEEIHKEHMAQEKAEEEKQRTAAAKKAEREKAKGEASKR